MLGSANSMFVYVFIAAIIIAFVTSRTARGGSNSRAGVRRLKAFLKGQKHKFFSNRSALSASDVGAGLKPLLCSSQARTKQDEQSVQAAINPVRDSI
jgi:hypothetical protein